MDWLFQFNPKRFDLLKVIEDGGRQEDWAMNQRRQLASPGDRVFFWQTGPAAQLVAVGRITSPVYERETAFGRYRVDIDLSQKIEPPITKAEILAYPDLRSFAPFKGAMGTNFPIQESGIVRTLEEMLQKRIVSLSGAALWSPPESPQLLDVAIKRAKQEASAQLRHYISQMDPTAFEWLARALLLKLGYRNVVVTKRSGDGGIDVRGILAAGGITKINTCIQVKRQQTVGRPIVQNLRGSLSAHEAGLLLTSGHFTEGAREEADDVHKVPISLIDGQRLTELLLENEIGVQQRTVKLYSLKLDELSKEELEGIVEEAEGDA